LVLAAALGLERLLRRKPADGRHLLLTLAAAGLLLLPALSRLLPRWQLEVLPRWAEPSSTAFVSSGEDAAPLPSAARETSPSPAAMVGHAAAMPASPAVAGRESRAPWIGSLLLAAWLVGITAAVVRLARALRSEGRLRATTR